MGSESNYYSQIEFKKSKIIINEKFNFNKNINLIIELIMNK